MVSVRIEEYVMGYTIKVGVMSFAHAYDTKENSMWKE